METMTYTAVVRYVAPIRVAAVLIEARPEHWQHRRATDRIGRWTGPARVEMRTFGIYYDDPAATPVSELRANACWRCGRLRSQRRVAGPGNSRWAIRRRSPRRAGHPELEHPCPVVVWHLAGTERRGAGQRADG